MAERQIFLSYSQDDEAKIRSLYDKLSAAGFEPWMDVKAILPGQNWEEAIEEAIKTSDFFLACLPKGSVDREWVLKELERALENWEKKRKSDIYLIPVKLEACEVPKSLQKFQWLDLYKRGGWNRLLRALRFSALPDRVSLITFEVEGSLEYFDEEEFKAALRDVVGADIRRIRITGIRQGSVKVTVEGDDKELTRILEALRDSEELQRKLSLRTRLTSVSYIQKGEQHTFRVRRRPKDVSPGLGIIAGFVAGVLGNLLADLIRQEWFSNPFTPPQAVVILLMTGVGLGASVLLSRRPLPLPKFSQLWPGHQLLTNVLAIVLLTVPAAALLSTALRGSCSGVEVSALEFRLTGERLKYPGSDITLRYLDLYNRQNLAGRAVFSDLPDGEQCACEWWGRTDKLVYQQLSAPSEAKDCIFSVPFQDGVAEINLTLHVGKQDGTSGFKSLKSFDFNIKVQQ